MTTKSGAASGGKKTPRGGSLRSSASTANLAAAVAVIPEDVAREYERKLGALATALQEKAEENAMMYEKLEDLKKRLASAESRAEQCSREITECRRQSERMRQDDKVAIDEMNRRVHTLTEAMTDLAQENVKLAMEKGMREYSAPANPAAEAEAMVSNKRAREKEVLECQRRVGELEGAVEKGAARVRDLEGRLKREEAQRQAYVESNTLYERKVVELEDKMQDSLQKEAARRQAAELTAKRLKQRVKDLEFLVQELQEEEDDDDEGDDGAEAGRKKAGKTRDAGGGDGSGSSSGEDD